MTRLSKLIKNTVVRSGALALATSTLIGLASSILPYNRSVGQLTDALALPGAWLISPLYPEGVHTGGGAPTWGIAVLISNFLVYAVFWCLCLKLGGYVLARKRGRESSEPSVRPNVT